MRYLWHLATRFFGSFMSRALSPGEQDEVASILAAPEASLFWRQQPVDQRHAWQVAQRVRASLGERPDAIAAALLHDVGKVHSGLGPISRSLATVLDHLHLPMPERWSLYRDHGALGAEDLRRAGAGPLAIAFADGEPGGDPATWRALIDADNGVATGGQTRASQAIRNSMPPEVNR